MLQFVLLASSSLVQEDIELKLILKGQCLIRNTILVRYKLNDDRTSIQMSLYIFRKLVFSLTHAFAIKNIFFGNTGWLFQALN